MPNHPGQERLRRPRRRRRTEQWVGCRGLFLLCLVAVASFLFVGLSNVSLFLLIGRFALSLCLRVCNGWFCLFMCVCFLFQPMLWVCLFKCWFVFSFACFVGLFCLLFNSCWCVGIYVLFICFQPPARAYVRTVARASLPPHARRTPKPFREPPLERVPGLYAALLSSADAMDENDITGVRGPKQSCFVDIEKVEEEIVLVQCSWWWWWWWW